ncbi:URC4/urg3 family protein [Noviherbaspirillum sp.]|uniref:URC4/urg3 family protein n=1 Tax=Noviherbaspirillum sp. TaxID=1926288 RepID=UPI002FE28015
MTDARHAGAHADIGWHTPVPQDHPAAALLNAQAVRRQCALVMARTEQGNGAHFTWHPDRLAQVACYVADTIRMRYPDLSVPYHSRWRHFETGGVDRWQQLAAQAGLSGSERARTRIDLVIPSVLLDAGAGPDWQYLDHANNMRLARSEGLGVASLALFASGALSSDQTHPLRTDASALAALAGQTVAAAFQVSHSNPLVGLAGRVEMLRRLGEVVAATPAVFGPARRLGNLFDYLADHAHGKTIDAAFILETLLIALGPVWPGRIVLDGVSLGDCWRHPDVDGGLLPFHKLTQWLTYSMLEPLEEAGYDVVGLDRLTGLPEYRNGGLLLDLGLLQPRDPAFFTDHLAVDRPEVVEWRALTVIGLDRVADAVRTQLGVSADAFPLARVLEGGTWAAGRRIAAERRPGGTPPVNILSDGTVF